MAWLSSVEIVLTCWTCRCVPLVHMQVVRVFKSLYKEFDAPDFWKNGRQQRLLTPLRCSFLKSTVSLQTLFASSTSTHILNLPPVTLILIVSAILSHSVASTKQKTFRLHRPALVYKIMVDNLYTLYSQVQFYLHRDYRKI